MQEWQGSAERPSCERGIMTHSLTNVLADIVRAPFMNVDRIDCAHEYTRDSGAVWELPVEVKGASVFTCDDCGEDVHPEDCDHLAVSCGFCERCGF